MIDLALDPISRDLIIPIRPISGAARVAQSVGIRLRTWLGNWFLDTTHGVPYLENILVKNPRHEIVESILRQQILGVAGVRAIKSFQLEINAKARTAKVTFEAESDEGLASGTASFGL